jgi:tetratricopeptide (TPR) repeat protein
MDDTSNPATLPSAPPGAAGVVAGRYHVRGRLGQGASKEVYLAYDERLDREVALALVLGAVNGTAARSRLEREARVTGRLGDHPNVITIYDTGEVDGVPYLVLRAMRGGSLADRLGRGRPALPDALRIGRDVAVALAHAHSHGVIHRDVKPGNIWLAADGGAALGDFGIAHELGADRLTTEGLVLGTVCYLSPEQVRGGEIGPASDVYALGVTLYELASGRPPFTGEDPAQVLRQHLTATPSPVDGPPALQRLIAELLAKLPDQRPSAAFVAEALAAMGPDSAVASAPRRPEARRVVAVLAVRADVADPEALHAALDRCSDVIERHGGSVELHLGDGLIGVFGLTETHGDEALRAARAAVELPAGLRIGIELGEVFVGSGPRGADTVTGAAITAARRLAEQAADDTIRLGDALRRSLAADATIDSGVLIELRPAVPLRVPPTPFIGRGAELDRLRAMFAEACAERTCRLVTVVGAAGIGKSRLSAEFTATLDDATLLAGRCLSYGEGTTYQALADIVRALDGRVETLLDGNEQAIRAVLGAVGLSHEPVPVEETAWAVRRLLERLAADRPLILVVEDIHWAEPPLLDLIDHVAALSSGAPILIVCLTRPELLEARPAWNAPQRNRSVLELEALDVAHARELAQRLGAGPQARRIAERAEGNPLFVEQLVAVGVGENESDLPVSIQAVLAARIDRTEPRGRLLLQRASVEGRRFHSGALTALVGASVGADLVALVRSGLIAADQPEFAGEEAFRFNHALIREVAYASVPKRMRSELHASLADWLDNRRAADEVIAYHLEQACRLAAELQCSGERERVLAARAVKHLKNAAQTAQARADLATASALLERALALTDKTDRGALLPALGAALFDAGRVTEARTVLDEGIAEAAPRLRARAQIEREFVRLEDETSAGIKAALRVADDVLPLLEREGDLHGQCRAWSLRALVAWIAGSVERADAAWSRAEALAGDERQRFGIIGWRATAAVLGPTPVDEAIRRCERFRDALGTSPVAVAWALNPLASLHAMRGEFELAEEFLRQANDTLDQLGGLGASVSHHEALVRLLAGQPERAEATLRGGADTLAEMSDGSLMATTSAMLAQALYAQGRADEAQVFCRMAAGAGGEEDIVTEVIWRGVEAKILARRDRFGEAEALAREAAALAEPTDLLCHRGDAMLDLGEVLHLCGRDAESDDAVRAGIALHEAKGNVAAVARARRDRPGEA